MATVEIETDAVLTEEYIAAVKAQLPDSDGEPLETPWHRACINLMIEAVLWRLRPRTDYFVGGNMFLYYSMTQARERLYRGPDFFFVKGVDGTRERRFWWVFEEDQRFPDCIIELNSPTTIKEDLTTKKDLYERVFRTPEYFCYDPDGNSLLGWRLVNGRYEPITPNEKGWLWSDQMRLWVGTWDGAYQGKKALWLRFYDENHDLVITETEYERLHALNAQKRAEQERQQAEAERQKAQAAQEKAEVEQHKAEAERERAETLQAEVERLQALLAEKGGPSKP